MNLVSPEASWRVRRFVAVLIGMWLGGILLVALAAPAAFRSVDSVMSMPPETVKKAMEKLGPTTLREILHYQVGEANRLLFEAWGTVQLVFGGLVFALLLFFTSTGRAALALAFSMFLLSGMMDLYLIPRITAIGREMRAYARLAPTEALGRFQILHAGFTVFELVVALLGLVLVVILLRTRGGTAARKQSGGEVSQPD
jgi:hypothetical protein